jgi:hypothetical protein
LAGRGARAHSQVDDERLEAPQEIAQTLHLSMKLFQRLFMDLLQCQRLASNGLLEGANPLVEILWGCGRQLTLGSRPLTKGEAETIQLRLEAR